MDKILITGAEGYIGSNLVSALGKEDCELHLLSRGRPSRQTSDAYNHYNLDLNQLSKVREVFLKVKPDVVVHLAAIGFRANKKYSLEELINFNFILTKKLVALSSDNNNFRRFIYPTTYMECAGSTEPIRSDSLLVPQSDYAHSKSLSTKYLLSLNATKKIHATMLRFFSVYGKNDLNFRFIPSVFDALAYGKNLETTDCKQMRDFVYIDDVTNAISKAVHLEDSTNRVFNIGNGKPIMLLDVVEKIKKMFMNSKGSITIGVKPQRPNESPCYYADITDSKELLGWMPAFDIDAGLNETYKWYVNRSKDQ